MLVTWYVVVAVRADDWAGGAAALAVAAAAAWVRPWQAGGWRHWQRTGQTAAVASAVNGAANWSMVSLLKIHLKMCFLMQDILYFEHEIIIYGRL